MKDHVPVPFGVLVLWLPRAVFEAALAEALGSAQLAAPAQPGMGRQQSAEPWLTTERLAAQTGLRPAHLRAQARAGFLKHRQVGRRYLFPPDVISGLGEGRATVPAAVGEEDVVPWKR